MGHYIHPVQLVPDVAGLRQSHELFDRGMVSHTGMTIMPGSSAEGGK